MGKNIEEADLEDIERKGGYLITPRVTLFAAREIRNLRTQLAQRERELEEARLDLKEERKRREKDAEEWDRICERHKALRDQARRECNEWRTKYYNLVGTNEDDGIMG